jgi:PadR family transcriptional regulator, regulatory protein AphA
VSLELSPTAKAILGTLSFSPKSGYEIKAMVDRSTRFFWAASYGQIYPELKRLAEAGLVEGIDDPQGGRARTVWSLTEEGREALHAWLSEPPAVFEIRHEGMLKVFFADSLSPVEQIERLRDMGAVHRRKVEALRGIEAQVGHNPANAVEALEKTGSFTFLILRYGIESNEWAAEWCERTATALESRSPVAERSR